MMTQFEIDNMTRQTRALENIASELSMLREILATMFSKQKDNKTEEKKND